MVQLQAFVMSAPINLIHWFGGKSNHLDFVLPLLPRTKVFVEAFGGSGAVIINREPSDVDVYNDLFEPVVNLMRSVKEDAERLAELIHLTPYSRREYELALTATNDQTESARRFLASSMQRHSAAQHTTRRSDWARGKNKTLRATTFMKKPLDILNTHARLQGVVIEEMDALEVIMKYDSPDTLFYLDPPYVASTRAFGHYGDYEYYDDDHENMARVANALSGKFAISGYNSDMYNELFPKDKGWVRYDNKTKKTAYAKGHVRMECLWCNYEVSNV